MYYIYMFTFLFSSNSGYDGQVKDVDGLDGFVEGCPILFSTSGTHNVL